MPVITLQPDSNALAVQTVIYGVALILCLIATPIMLTVRSIRLQKVLPRRTHKLRKKDSRNFRKLWRAAPPKSPNRYLPQHSPFVTNWRETDARLALSESESTQLRQLTPSENGIDLARAVIRNTTTTAANVLAATTIALAAGFLVAIPLRGFEGDTFDAIYFTFSIAALAWGLSVALITVYEDWFRTRVFRQDQITIRSLDFLRVTKRGPISTNQERKIRHVAGTLEAALDMQGIPSIGLRNILKDIQFDNGQLDRARILVINMLVGYYRGDYIDTEGIRKHPERSKSEKMRWVEIAISFTALIVTILGIASQF